MNGVGMLGICYNATSVVFEILVYTVNCFDFVNEHDIDLTMNQNVYFVKKFIFFYLIHEYHSVESTK